MVEKILEEREDGNQEAGRGERKKKKDCPLHSRFSFSRCNGAISFGCFVISSLLCLVFFFKLYVLLPCCRPNLEFSGVVSCIDDSEIERYFDFCLSTRFVPAHMRGTVKVPLFSGERGRRSKRYISTFSTREKEKERSGICRRNRGVLFRHAV